MGFFTDAYDLFCIPVVSKLLGRIYYYTPGSGLPGALPANVNAAVNGVALCGTLAGQLFFGWLGELLTQPQLAFAHVEDDVSLLLNLISVKLADFSPDFSELGS